MIKTGCSPGYDHDAYWSATMERLARINSAAIAGTTTGAAACPAGAVTTTAGGGAGAGACGSSAAADRVCGDCDTGMHVCIYVLK